jgi:hypothetical protein
MPEAGQSGELLLFWPYQIYVSAAPTQSSTGHIL